VRKTLTTKQIKHERIPIYDTCKEVITMNKVFSIAVLILLLPVLVWAGGSKDNSKREESSSSGVSLMEAIDLSAGKIVENIGAFADRIAEAAGKHRIAVVAFESESDALSDFIMAELSGVLFDRNIEIVERQGLNWVIKELDFQMSGAVSDETMQSIGKFMGAELIVTGQLRNLGDTYRLTANAIRVEQATRASIPRFDVRNDRAMQNMIAALANQTLNTRAADYGVTVDTKAETAGTFLDRGIQFAMRSEFEKAIADFTQAIQHNSNNAFAYLHRGISYHFRNSSGDIDRAIRAIADFEAALRIEPNNADAKQWLDAARQARGR